jgi:hypothetical protein
MSEPRSRPKLRVIDAETGIQPAHRDPRVMSDFTRVCDLMGILEPGAALSVPRTGRPTVFRLKVHMGPIAAVSSVYAVKLGN